MQSIVEYAIPASIRNQLENNQEEQDYLTHYSKVLLNQTTFAAMVSEKAPGALKPPRLIWVNSRYFGLSLNIFVTVSGFTTEAAPRLAEFLEFLSDHYENPPSSQDAASSGTRIYSYQADPENPDRISVEVFAELLENSENCQRIITGTRKVQKLAYVDIDEPIYAFKC
jgi:hypothetical protein